MSRLWLLAALTLTAPVSAAPLVWTIEGPQARHVLAGSVHLLPESAGAALPAALNAAYAAADSLVFETDLAALAQPDTQRALMQAAAAEQPLQAQIPAALYRRLQARVAALAVPLSMFERVRPWFAAMTLEVLSYQQAGYRPEYGVEQQLFERAQADGKTLRWLEAPAAHLATLTEMSPALAQRFLEATLDEQTPGAQSADDLIALWQVGDLDGLATLVADLRQRYPGVYARLLADRNHAWLPGLQEILASDTPSLIVVGAAHLPGPDGLLAQLQRAGISVSRAP